jgi:hypothetical protein
MAYTCRYKHRNADYLRYADDQIIMAESLQQAREILVDAGRYLHEIGLNIGAAKVREFMSREDYDHYWTFELMELLGDETDDAKINRAAAIFNQLRIQDGQSRGQRPWRWPTVERRILRVGLRRISEPTRSQIAERLLQEESVERMDEFMLAAVARGLTEAERKMFFAVIDSCVPRVPFNFFHLNLRRFFARYEKPWRPIDEIESRIDELNRLWSPN